MSGKKVKAQRRQARKSRKPRRQGQTNYTAARAAVPRNQLTVYKPALQPMGGPQAIRALQHVRSMCDPFSDESRGCLIADGYIAPRLPVRGETLQNISSTFLQGGTTAGTAAIYWFPTALCTSYATTAGTSGGAWILPTSGWVNVLAPFWPSGASTGRRVCAGMKIRPNGVATATAGSAIVTEVLYPTDGPVGSMAGVDVRSYTLVPGLEITCLSRPTGPQSQLPTQYSATEVPTYASGVIPAYTGFVVQFQGVPAGMSIDVQLVENAEAFLDATASQSQYVPVPPPRHDAVMGLVDKVRHEVGGILQTGVGAVGENLRSKILDALRPATRAPPALLALMP